MNEADKYEMIDKENQMLKAELRETLQELEAYKERFGELSEAKEGSRKMDFKKIIHESKEKIQDKIQESLKDEKVKESVEKGKDISEKAKRKVVEGSNLAVDALKSAKKVLFNPTLKENLKAEFEQQRKQRESTDENNNEKH